MSTNQGCNLCDADSEPEDTQSIFCPHKVLPSRDRRPPVRYVDPDLKKAYDDYGEAYDYFADENDTESEESASENESSSGYGYDSGDLTDFISDEEDLEELLCSDEEFKI